MTEQDPRNLISVGIPDLLERRKRLRELVLAASAFLFIVLSTWAELRFIRLESYLFFVLFNFNFLLLLVILGVVLRNVVKLVLERRRRVLGSKLRSRMVLAFMTLSLVPTLLLFVMSIRFVQMSVDYWFKAQVERSMEQSLKVGQIITEASRQRLDLQADHVILTLRDQARPNNAVPSVLPGDGRAPQPDLQRLFAVRAAEGNLAVLGLVASDGSPRQIYLDDGLDWWQVRSGINWSGLGQGKVTWAGMIAAGGRDFMVELRPMGQADGYGGYLVLAEVLSPGLKDRLEQIVQGLDEFKKLKLLKRPVKVALYMTLGVMTLLIFLAALFFGFRMAKELSAPIQALAAGTQRIAQGDLAVRLMDQSDDELGYLVSSFNRMAADLEQSQSRLTQANARLELQNRELESWGRYMAAVLDNITAGVVSMDRHGRISTVNKAAEAMLGIDSQGVLGKTPLDLLHGEYADLVREIMGRMAQGHSSQWQRQVGVRLADQEFKYLVNVVVLRAEDGHEAGLVAVFEDIGEMEKMQRLAAWREVARRIAHEIKNPLTPIKLSAQRIERKYGPVVDDPALGEATRLIVRHVEHLQRMVEEFSAFAKLPEISPRVGSLVPVAEEVVTLFRSGHSGIDFRLEVAPDLPELALDVEAMRRVLINVMSNSVEALGDRPGGQIIVRLEPSAEPGFVRLEVADNGPGLSEEERRRLFEPYFSRKKGGTGLGLTIVRSIITDHHGFVRVAQSGPTGTSIVVDLPGLQSA